jgi:hypothetical protein
VLGLEHPVTLRGIANRVIQILRTIEGSRRAGVAGNEDTRAGAGLDRPDSMNKFADSWMSICEEVLSNSGI